MLAEDDHLNCSAIALSSRELTHCFCGSIIRTAAPSSGWAK
jgi:hypothetical protein